MVLEVKFVHKFDICDLRISGFSSDLISPVAM
jgi:hypothetical protein